MSYKEFFAPLHKKTKRDYLSRVNAQKPECMKISREYGYDYWDGDRKYGYGGYHYDGRWAPMAQNLVNYYHLNHDSKILDVGCGKGFLIYELKKILTNSQIFGLDISQYAIDNAKDEIKNCIRLGNSTQLPFENKSFDLVISNGALHNLKLFDLFKAVKEIQRVSKGKSWICVESFRNEDEQFNMMNWSLSAQAFLSSEEWEWIFNTNGYSGDWEFFYFN